MGQRFKSVSRHMYFHQDKYTLSDPLFLSYFVPQKLSKERIFRATTFYLEKNEIALENFRYIVPEMQQKFFSCLENRFWAYDKKSFFENQEFSLCFQTLDYPTKTLEYSKRRRKLSGYFSFLSALKESDKLFKRTNKTFLIKSRLLRLTRGGFISSCIGNSAFILRSSSFYKFRKHSSYKGWFSSNIAYYGVLSFFSIVRFEKKIVAFPPKYQRSFLSQRVKFYYLKNRRVKYFFLLGKPKTIKLL